MSANMSRTARRRQLWMCRTARCRQSRRAAGETVDDRRAALVGRMAQRRDEDRIQAVGRRREELDDEAVVEREPARSETLRVRGQVGAAARNAGLQVREAIAPVAEGGEDRVERREEEQRRRRVATERLLEGE